MRVAFALLLLFVLCAACHVGPTAPPAKTPYNDHQACLDAGGQWGPWIDHYGCKLPGGK